jgi:cyanophycinase-like exopeptidase
MNHGIMKAPFVVDCLGELDLPFLTMLFLITAPYQAMTLRFVDSVKKNSLFLSSVLDVHFQSRRRLKGAI